METPTPGASSIRPRFRSLSSPTPAMATADDASVKREIDLQPGAADHGSRVTPTSPSLSPAVTSAKKKTKKNAGGAKLPHVATAAPPTEELKVRVASAPTVPLKIRAAKGSETVAVAAAAERKRPSTASAFVKLGAFANASSSSSSKPEVANVVPRAAANKSEHPAVPMPSPKPKSSVRQPQQQRKTEARGAQSRAAELRQLELDETKEIAGALARVSLVREAIRGKLLPLLDAYDAVADVAAAAAASDATDREGIEESRQERTDGDEKADGDADDGASERGKVVAPLSASTLAEFVPLREFCTACWFIEPTNISDERHARERAAARLSNKMRGLGVTRLVAHPTVSRCIALRESKQTVHTRWCTLADAIRIAAVGPSCPARYPECESLVKQLERAAKSRAVATFLAARAAETERLDGGGGGGGGGGADTQEGATNTGDATFFIPLSLFADVPRTPRGAAVKPPQEQQRRRNLQALSEIDDRGARNSDLSDSASSSSPPLATDDDTDTEPEDNGGNRARRSDSPKKEDGVQDGKLKVAAKSADRGPTQHLKRRAPRQGGGGDDDDDDDDDDADRVSVDSTPVAATATIANKGPARTPAVGVANRGVKKTSMVAAAAVVAVASPSPSVREHDKPVKREKKRRTIEPEEPVENKDADSAATPVAAVAAHRAAAAPTHVRVPLDLGALTLSELEEQIKRSALIVQIAQNNALINEANRRAETSGGSRIVDAFM